MTTLTATAGPQSAAPAPAGRVPPWGASRARLAALAMALGLGAAGVGAATAATITDAAARQRHDAFLEQLEHARRVDDLRNQQLRWLR